MNTLQQDIHAITNADRSARRASLNNLHRTLFPNGSSGTEDLDEVLRTTRLLPQLLLGLKDEVDKCRELSLALLHKLACTVSEYTPYQAASIAAVKDRLGDSALSLPEKSEEQRLELVKFISEAIFPRATHNSLAPATGADVAHILVRAAGDPFHEVRKAGCTAIAAFTQTAPADFLQPHTAHLLAALIPCYRHAHLRVRTAAVNASCAIFCKATVSLSMLKDSILPALKALITDKSAQLRRSTYSTISTWLCSAYERPGWPAEYSRLQLTALLLPTLLLGFTDASPDICGHCSQLLEHTSARFDLHRSSLGEDVPSPEPGAPPVRPSHEQTASPGTLPATQLSEQAVALLPSAYQRASPAARAMLQHVLASVLPPILREVREWTTSLRSMATRSLLTVATVAEDCVAPHMMSLLPALCQAVVDDEQAVALRVVGTAHVVGVFCESAQWLPVLLDHLASVMPAPTAVTGALIILVALTHAAARVHKQLPPELLRQLAIRMSSDSMRGMEQRGVQRQLVLLTANIVELAAGDIAEDVAHKLFTVLLQLRGSTADDEYLQGQVAEAHEALAKALGLETASDLVALFASAALQALCSKAKDWTASHPDVSAFVSLLTMSTSETLASVGSELCSTMGKITGDHDRDDAMRMQLLRAVDRVLEDDGQAAGLCGGHGLHLLADVLLPPLVWRAGKSAAAVRYAALTAVLTALSKRRLDVQALTPLLAPKAQLIPLLLQVMDEDWYEDTRRAGCFALRELMCYVGCQLDDVARRQIYPELTKRMDDSSVTVRVAAAYASLAFVEHALPEAYCETNTGYFLAAMLVHLDDGNADVREMVLRVLCALAQKKPRTVKEHVAKVYNDFVHRDVLDTLLTSCSTTS